MKRSILICVVFAAAAAFLGAQEDGQANPYQGTSNPPPDDTIVTSQAAAPIAKPSAGRPVRVQPIVPAPVQRGYSAQPASADPARNYPATGDDDGIVQVASDSVERPALNRRNEPYDPDGDIVHPTNLGPGQLGEGTVIRVRLLNRISTADAVNGDRFRSRVSRDVQQGGQVLIPVGSEIDGRILEVSSGTPGGRGSMHLRPDSVILPDGSRYKLYAQLIETPGSNTNVRTEGRVDAGSRLKRDGIEYGGAMGAGAITGAYVGGPVGALAGTLIGAGVITAHLLISHPQATLETGTILVFTLTHQLNLTPVSASGE